MDQAPSREQSTAKLRDLIEQIEIACLTTIDHDGSLRSRPMVTREMDEDEALWFFTSDYSAAADEVVLNPQVCVTYASPEKNRFVSVSGTAELSRDAARMQQLWAPTLKAWFPKGLKDPDLALLRVDPVSAQYWDAPSSKLVQLRGLIRAMAKGEKPETGENRKLTLKHRIGSDTAT